MALEADAKRGIQEHKEKINKLKKEKELLMHSA